MSLHNNSSESLTAISAKAGPSVGVSLATLGGYNISEVVLWATLVYTVLMITHKLWQMYKDFTKKDD